MDSHERSTGEPGKDLLLPILVLYINPLRAESRETLARSADRDNRTYLAKHTNKLFFLRINRNHSPDRQRSSGKALVEVKRAQVDHTRADIGCLIRQSEASVHSSGDRQTKRSNNSEENGPNKIEDCKAELLRKALRPDRYGTVIQ